MYNKLIMSVHGELIDLYVSAEAAAESLAPADLSDAELGAAIPAVQRERAQWVVDAITVELGSRAVELKARQQGLETEVRSIQSDLEVIEAIMRREPVLSQDEKVQKRIGQYMTAYTEKDAKQILSDQEPFTLRLGTQDSPSLYESWTNRADASNEIRNIYGKSILSSMSRARYALSRLIPHEFNSLSDEQKATCVRGARYYEIDGEHILEVINPSAFFDALFDVRNFGYKAMVAVLCLADFQAANPDLR